MYSLHWQSNPHHVEISPYLVQSLFQKVHVFLFFFSFLSSKHRFSCGRTVCTPALEFICKACEVSSFFIYSLCIMTYLSGDSRKHWKYSGCEKRWLSLSMGLKVSPITRIYMQLASYLEPNSFFDIQFECCLAQVCVAWSEMTTRESYKSAQGV